ncbi:hypothetical protein X801_07324 [Opisthorchis viverrini]|uniref:Uncharacterized protein n=1 Tax=Opisthorchis viverrini TaxID=6198 RepID=A0A1S8WQW4_OPIVI|nr:hypothetical protein X801_07324 [Opisthorchis viverrini]
MSTQLEVEKHAKVQLLLGATIAGPTARNSDRPRAWHSFATTLLKERSTENMCWHFSRLTVIHEAVLRAAKNTNSGTMGVTN